MESTSKAPQSNVFYGEKIKKIPKLILRPILGPWILTGGPMSDISYVIHIYTTL